MTEYSADMIKNWQISNYLQMSQLSIFLNNNSTGVIEGDLPLVRFGIFCVEKGKMQKGSSRMRETVWFISRWIFTKDETELSTHCNDAYKSNKLQIEMIISLLKYTIFSR